MLRMQRTVYDAIIDRGREGAPEEVCGVLAGDYGDEESAAIDSHPIENVAERPETRYELNPETLLSRIDDIESRGLDVVGFYHTHPTGPPHPSVVDAERATWCEYSYVICAYDGHPFVGSWRWREGGFEQELVSIGVE